MSGSLDAKIGQMIMVGFRGFDLAERSPLDDCIRNLNLGAVWLCNHVSPTGESLGDIASPAQVRELVARLQQAARVPLLVAIDAEGGQVVRLKPEFGFPPTLSAAQLGRSGDAAVTGRQSQQIAETLRDLGVNLNLAPAVDLLRNVENPSLAKKERCFSDDPRVVYDHARAFIEQHHLAGILCTLKHFPGQGSARDDTHDGFTDVSDAWSRDELKPFREMFHDGLADAVLVSHVFNRHLDEDYPASLSPAITTDLLRNELGFDGVVLSDDLGMGAIIRHYDFDEALALAIDAGVDIVVHANTGLYHPDIGRRVFNAVRRLVETGRISEQRLDCSCRRIHRLKARLGEAAIDGGVAKAGDGSVTA